MTGPDECLSVHWHNHAPWGTWGKGFIPTSITSPPIEAEKSGSQAELQSLLVFQQRCGACVDRGSGPAVHAYFGKTLRSSPPEEFKLIG